MRDISCTFISGRKSDRHGSKGLKAHDNIERYIFTTAECGDTAWSDRVVGKSGNAVAVAEKHNADGKMPFIELWSESRLETLLSQRPDLIAGHGLRP